MPIGDSGIIEIRSDLPPFLKRCVLAHEMHHAAGYTHLAGRFPFVDCGDGTWLSAETVNEELNTAGLQQ